MNIEKINEICIEIYGKLAGDFEYRFVEAIEQAARATAEQRDSVIEECAAVVDKFANSATDNSTQFILDICSDDIRALKSQQDAAIEAKRGDGS